jgi:hypothetical protein
MTNDVLRKELINIYERCGQLTAALVVEEAEPDDSPLHDQFEWDDESAGHRYRLTQARALIRSVRIRVVESDPKSETVRAFINVQGPAEPTPETLTDPDPVDAGYLPVEEIGQSPRLRSIALAQMEREWRLFKRRWQQYEEFWKLVDGG